jgi:hypothetical protein
MMTRGLDISGMDVTPSKSVKFMNESGIVGDESNGGNHTATKITHVRIHIHIYPIS